MSRLPALTATKIIRVLYSVGFRNKHQRGSHIFFEHQYGRATIVPMHKGEDVGRGLLRKILRDIKMEPQDFVKLL